MIPAVDGVLRCPICAAERPFARPPLLVVTGTAAIGKSTLCARLAGTVPGVLALDADVFAEDMVSVVPPNRDYPAFWRSMLRLAHELAQNDVAVAFFSTMLPGQVLAGNDLLSYFASVHFLCLTCSPEVLRERLARREGSDPTRGRIQVWLDFDAALRAAAEATPTASVIDAGREPDVVADDVRRWIERRVHSND